MPRDTVCASSEESAGRTGVGGGFHVPQGQSVRNPGTEDWVDSVQL